MPEVTRAAAADWLERGGAAAIDRLSRARASSVPGALRFRQGGEKAVKLAKAVRATSPEAIYDAMRSHWDDPSELERTRRDGTADVAWLQGPEPLTRRLMRADLTTYLPDDILTKVDRASMAVALEVRTPFLDPDLVEWAWRLPTALKVSGSTGKRVVRRHLSSQLPRDVMDRPKTGFGVPLAAWLRGPLRDWATSLLEGSRLTAEGWLRVDSVRDKWQEHLAGTRDWHYQLWDVLMFEAWMREYPVRSTARAEASA
jgi:asparagine synthase (glutamine-hydrolysing)